ncbi:MAG: hypothetical protein ACKOZY_09290, partial [Flavobacteriales bacterium]
ALDSYPDSTSVAWFVDGNLISTYASYAQAFMAGQYLIEAVVDIPACPSAIPLSYDLQTSACGFNIQSVQPESGFFTFTAVGYPEEYPMYWQLGNDTLLWETWVVDHVFDIGLHEVCAWYTSDFCPDTIRNCITVEVLPPPCTAAFLTDNSQPMLLQCYSFETDPNASFMWFVDGTAISEESDPSIALYPGIRTVCLEVATPTCTSTFCDTVTILCDFPTSTVEMSLISYGSSPGTDNVLLQGYSGLYEVINETLSISTGDTLRWIYCLDVNCFVGVLWRDALVPMQADSLVITGQFLSPNAEMTRFVLYPSGEASYTDDVTSPDCIWWSVEEQGDAHAWEAFPNPTNDVLHFRGQPGKIQFLDSHGRILESFRPSAGGMSISLGDLPPGIYILLDEYGRAQRIMVE